MDMLWTCDECRRLPRPSEKPPVIILADELDAKCPEIGRKMREAFDASSGGKLEDMDRLERTCRALALQAWNDGLDCEY
jgi:hypothetical protein